MKKLIVALIVLTPFIGVSQDNPKPTGAITLIRDCYISGQSTNAFIGFTNDGKLIYPKPDTLSAYLLITTRHMGIAYQRRGFVVRQYGKEDIYLDCDKKTIKAPFTIWHAKLINQPK